MGFSELVDALDEIGHPGEPAARDGLLADHPEAALDLVELGRVVERDVDLVARLGRQPGLDLDEFGRRVVVGDQMDVEIGRHILVDQAR